MVHINDEQLYFSRPIQAQMEILPYLPSLWIWNSAHHSNTTTDISSEWGDDKSQRSKVMISLFVSTAIFQVNLG